MCRMTQLAAQKFVTASGKHELKNLKEMGKKEITEVAKIRTGCRRIGGQKKSFTFYIIKSIDTI